MPRALVTNDDGIDSPGLHALVGAALEAGLEVIVAAPAEQASGASAALSAVRRDGRTVVEQRKLAALDGVEAWAVQAQPGHIVAAALNGWFDPRPDLVLSGINHGANVGRAILHSGTVGAALTAKISDTRALAVSLDVALHPTGERHWKTAAGLLAPVLDLLLDAPEGTVLSLNVPDRPADEIGPIRHARLARGGAVQTKVEEVRNGGVRLTEVEVPDQPEEDTDSALLDAGHPTLTELRSVEAHDGDLVRKWLADES
ncbi:5'/3'-nucleotidase SurE [Mycolicibacterium novocastrense]|uniref:5'/3'-nucleotidase SurE n=1 Tax=Mycolicibacterium novocastrense TaxID=59813 RepID=UPI000748AA52|nr:5'/3'-nucleotidase SurE [Mycolicibacterium novocastrense]KUH70813.1 5'/3'-nucleotidase SurE [Mycolicibacterium novocastrense]KUH71154.1 5'/3'-nucleotidase SurE [Mycolicibacterium novocastrense]KUH73329.1 5'/3'-nucleotidase SurE [Mycolicibacterium novocastrense]